MGDQEEKSKTKEILEYMVKFADLKYQDEVNRENSIIQQAATMQAAFSFMTAAIAMIIPVVCQYRGNITLSYLLVVFSSILGALLVSLIFATKALERKKGSTFLDVKDMNIFIEENEEGLGTEEQRLKHYAKYIGDVQESLMNNNEKRVFWLRLSQYVFYAAIALCVFWFFESLVVMCS